MMEKRILAISSLVLLDQLVKYIVRTMMLPGQSVPVVSNVLHLTYVQNTGAVWGILKNTNILFVLISFFALGALYYYRKELHKLSFVLLYSGVIANLVDRMVFGFVTDFIDFRIWPVFNIADSMLTIGIISVIILSIKKSN